MRIERLLADQSNDMEELLALWGSALSAQIEDGFAATQNLITATTAAGNATIEIDSAVGYLKRDSVDVAFDMLLKIRKSPAWSSLSARQKFRTAANLGHCKTRIEEFGPALAYFQEALSHQPHDAEARGLVAAAQFTAGDDVEALRLATELLKEHPDAVFGHVVVIRLDDSNTSSESLWKALPPSIHYDIHVLATIAWRAHRYMEFDFARTLTAAGIKDEDNRLEFEILNTVIDVSEISVAIENAPPLTAEQSHKLESAVTEFERLEERIVRTPGRQQLGQFYFYYAGAFRLLGQLPEAGQIYRQAVRAWPSATDIGRQYAQLLRDQNRVTDAIKVLETGTYHASDLKSCVFLAFLLADRKLPDDRKHAVALLRRAVANGGDIDLRELSNAFNLLGLLEAESDNSERVRSRIREHSRTDLTQAHRLSLQATTYRVSGEFEQAAEFARQALDALSLKEDDVACLDVALCCMGCKLYGKALSAFKRIVTTDSPLPHIEWILECASRSEDIAFLLEFCEKLRESGSFVENAIDFEVYYRQKFGDTDGAIAVLDAFLSLDRNDDFTKLVRLRKALIGVQFGRPELSTVPLEDLPSWEAASPEVGTHVTVVLRGRGDGDDALRYAYNLRRRFPMAAAAHRAFYWAVGAPADLDRLPTFDSVQPGTAVEYVEVLNGEPGVWVLEDCAQPNLDRRELPLDHPTALALAGKSLGDEFVLRVSGSQIQNGKIGRIYSKYVYAYKEILDTWQDRFPDEFLVQKFEIPRSGSADSDLSPIFQMLDDRAAMTERLHDVYRSHPLSITSFAVMGHVDAIDAVSHLTSSTDLEVRCCFGNANEHDASLLHAGIASQLALCPSAIATLWQTRTWELLGRLQCRLVVATGVIEQVRRRASDGSFRGEGFLAKLGDDYIYTKHDEEEAAERDASFRQFHEWLRAHSDIESGLALTKLPPEQRSHLRDLFGFEAAQTIAIAKDRSLTLWTDDLAVAEVSRHELEVSRTWTEVVLQHLRNVEDISPAEFAKQIAVFNGCRYRHTRLTPDAILEAAKLASWDHYQWPFPAVAQWCGSRVINMVGIAQVSAHALPKLYAEAPTVDAARHLCKAMLEGVISLPEGKQILRAIKNNLHRLFDRDTDSYNNCHGLLAYLIKGHL